MDMKHDMAYKDTNKDVDKITSTCMHKWNNNKRQYMMESYRQ